MSHNNQINPNDQVEGVRFRRGPGLDSGAAMIYMLGVLALSVLLVADVCEAQAEVPAPAPAPRHSLETVETHTKLDASYLVLRPNPVQRCICWLAKGLEGYLGRCACQRISPWDPTIPPLMLEASQ